MFIRRWNTMLASLAAFLAFTGASESQAGEYYRHPVRVIAYPLNRGGVYTKAPTAVAPCVKKPVLAAPPLRAPIQQVIPGPKTLPEQLTTPPVEVDKFGAPKSPNDPGAGAPPL
jgi:hypothetical protein